MPTIFAPATAPGRAGVSLIRISGPEAGAALRTLAGALPEPRRASLRHLRHGDDLLDTALVLWFPAPASFTGEDVVELHLHGGRAVLSGVLEALALRPGLRPAEPGEFTRRAFDHGRLDLTSVEGMADLVEAETAAQRRLALRQMEGGLARLYDGWRERLVEAMAYAEAEIDFAEEELPAGLDSIVTTTVRDLIGSITQYLDDGQQGERLRDGFSVVILGEPNVGKSSLLNHLARREAAIVSSQAGTTRDLIEVHLDLGGYPVILVDTAGLRDDPEEIEAEGIRRAKARAEQADLKLLLIDASQIDVTLQAMECDEKTFLVYNKLDCCDLQMQLQLKRLGMAISVKSGEGLEQLESRLQELVIERFAGLGAGQAPITRLRHRQALQECLAALQRALAASMPDLLAEDLRLAARALGRLTGRVEVEEVLDHIFSEFCIGK
jgi:tRNA modification GTPase